MESTRERDIEERGERERVAKKQGNNKPAGMKEES